MFGKSGKLGSSSSTGIVTIDPYSLKTYQFNNNLFEIATAKELHKNSFYISYIQTKDLIASTVDINRNVTDEDLQDAIEIKAYDELGLDGEIEYSIFYFESDKQEGDEKVFNVIAVDKTSLTDIFSEVKNINYVDYVTTAPLLFKSLYQKSLLTPEKTDCFIYLHKDDAFVTIYQNGEHVFSKSIRYSLKNISDTFSRELGKRVGEEEFYEMLSTSGLQNKNNTYQQQLMKLFGEVFVYINDVVSFAKRAHKLDEIHQIFLGTEIGNISGWEEYCFNYVNIPTQKLEFKIAKNSDDVWVDPMHTLLALSAQEFQLHPDDNFNISIFKRPPPFRQRSSGKLVQIVGMSFILSMLYPTYQFVYESVFLQQELRESNLKHENLVKISSKRKVDLAKVIKLQKNVDLKLDEKNKDLDFRTKLLEEIYTKKVSYPMKAKVLTNLFAKIIEHKSKVVSVENINKDTIINVESSADKYITELMKDLANYSSYDVSTGLISKDENRTIYQSAIKVRLNVE